MDERIRKAQRAWQSERTLANLAAYWHACLRAGILPEPNDIQFYNNNRDEYCIWRLTLAMPWDQYYIANTVALITRQEPIRLGYKYAVGFKVPSSIGLKYINYRDEVIAKKRVRRQLTALLRDAGYE